MTDKVLLRQNKLCAKPW